MQTGIYHTPIGFYVAVVFSIIFGLIALILILGGISALAFADGDRDAGTKYGFGCLGPIIGVFIILGILGGWFPYEDKYHKYQEITGTVDHVASRMVSSGDKGSDEKIVIRFKETGEEYGCPETRCAIVQPGDHLTLNCKLSYDFSGADGWDCKWNKNEPGGQE